MKNDIIKYIAALIVIIAVVWWLLYKDNSIESQALEEIETEPTPTN